MIIQRFLFLYFLFFPIPFWNGQTQKQTLFEKESVLITVIFKNLYN
nr:MAG TPA: hypothetical protein [Caudoviricetes sp.]DAX53808.1 MAG TPA: hypothetical protein [Caudoviricetes sp.]